MQRDEYAGLFARLKRLSRGRCLDNGPVLEAWLAENPQAQPEAARYATPGLAAPWPSIEGNPPVYRDRPWYDARFLDRIDE